MLPRARLSTPARLTTTSTLTLTPASLTGHHADPSNETGLLERWESDKRKGRCISQISWGCRWDFYVAILSFAIDSRSWSTLTVSCKEHGGAAYLVARLISTFVVAIPLLFFEISIGQLSHMGPWKFFGSGNLRPIFSGVGVFLLLTSVYKVVSDSASSLSPISQTLTLLVGDAVEGYLLGYMNNDTVAFENNTAVIGVMQGFTHLDALTVVSLSITWILAVLTVICGIKFISKVSYITCLVPCILIGILVIRAIHSDASLVSESLSAILAPSWTSLLSLSTWIRAITDSILSFNLGFGVIAFLSSLNNHKFSCLKSSFTVALLHTLVLGVMLTLSACMPPGTLTGDGLPVNQTTVIELIAVGFNRTLSSPGWMITFYTAIFMLNVDALVFVSYMLASSFSNLSWRPVLAVLIGAFFYVICLPLATRSRDSYMDMIQTFAVDLLPLMALLLMLVATLGSLRPNSLVDLVEFAAKFKLSFRGQSYAFVLYNSVLPLALLMCIVDGVVRLSSFSRDGVMTAMGQALLCLPWAALVLTPVYVAVCHYRHLPRSKRWRELWHKSEYEDWLYRRPQLAGGDEDGVSNSIYELPERVSSSRPISSSYYSSAATILASDSAVYSAYY